MSFDDDIDTSVLLLDVETTGTNKAVDQVIELAIQYGFDAHDPTGFVVPAPVTVWRFKPDVPIHPEAARVHGISIEMLADAPAFRVHAQRILELIDQAAVLIGYNVSFDLEMLQAEAARAGLTFPALRDTHIVDPLRIWHHFEPRTLAAAHARFVGDGFENAHSAAADIAATGRVAIAMFEQFGLSGQPWDAISELCNPDRKFWLGNTGHLRWAPTAADGVVVVITFGKHKDAALHELAVTQPGYLRWVLKQDFPPHVKQICHEAVSRRGGGYFLSWARAAYPPPANGGS